jgi:N-acetylneuraminic acid mutarotase
MGFDTEHIGEKRYQCGGASMLPDPTLRIYNPEKQHWEAGPDMPVSKLHHCTAVVGGKLYAIGGQLLGENPQFARGPGLEKYKKGDPIDVCDSVHIYDPAANEWSEGPPLATERKLAAATACNGKIYVIGGFDGEDFLSSVEVFDPAKGAWSEGPPISFPAQSIAVTTQETGEIYAFGGYVPRSRFLPACAGYL